MTCGPANIVISRWRGRLAPVRPAWHKSIYSAKLTVADFILDKGSLLIVNNEHLNFLDEPKDIDLLLGRIGSMHGGREFFNWAE